MKQLGDRIKDRLEGYESSLPEGDLAEFKALLDASPTSGAKRNPAYLLWLAPVAAAAGLALFFGLGHGPHQDVIQEVGNSSLVADVVPTSPAEVVGPAETETIENAAANQINPIIPRRTNKPDAAVAVSAEPENEDSGSNVSEQSTPDQVGNNEQAGRTGQKEEEKRKDAGSSMSNTDYSPFIPSGSSRRKPVSVKVGRATAGVLGGTGAIALASALPSILMKYDSEMSYDPVGPEGIHTDPEPLIDVRTGKDTHHMPLKTGLSLRLPLSEKWSLTTGATYSWYSSKIGYSLSGDHDQDVHYFGIPLRADLTIARNRWMDVFVGAGGSVDFCVAAYDTGRKTTKDGVGFALVGAGGVQFNISRNLGLFLEPNFSWDMTSGNRALYTYRSEHPFMFAVSTGLRFTLPTKGL